MPYNWLWNWQQEDWPEFRFETDKLQPLEDQFLHQAGMLSGAIRHVADDERQQFIVDLISDEALYTSEIEGEILDRVSLQSSIRRNFGLSSDHRRVPPAEHGIAELMVDQYRNFDAPLTDGLLLHWHQLLMANRNDLKDIGRYRTGSAPMQVVSGRIDEPKVHFEAPPSSALPAEMSAFVDWFNATGPQGNVRLPVLTRAGIAHLYFVCIHPFEDGNGRIARCLAEKAISEGLGQPVLMALSQTINRRRKNYYDALEFANKDNEISAWLDYFARTILEAQIETQRLLDFIIEKTKYYNRFRGQFNPRQDKVITRMMREGPSGFKGGLSADNYISLTKASRATATRDLADLVAIGALIRTGKLKGTRYHLPFPLMDCE